jgi:hypothetical protein
MTEYHPLFPPNDDEEDEEAPDIQAILIQRKENGKYVTAPGSFMPGDMNSLARLYGEFGGGDYQLLGRAGNGRIIRRVVHTLPGPPKPMYDEGPAPKPQPVAANPMSALMGAGTDGGIMGIIMMMMQNMMQQANQASERQTQMMLAMMTTAGNSSAAQIAAMQENMRAQAERDQRDKQAQIELMLKLSEAKGSGNSTGGEDSFFKGVEFMRHFSTQQLEMMKQQAAGKSGGDFDLEGIIGTVLEALQGFNAFKEFSGAGGLPGAAGAAAPEVVS